MSCCINEFEADGMLEEAYADVVNGGNNGSKKKPSFSQRQSSAV